MSESVYPVPQAPVTGTPSPPPWPQVVFALPGTLPVVTPIRGVPQEALVVNPPQLVFVVLPVANPVPSIIVTAVDQDVLPLIGPSLLVRPAIADLAPIFVLLPRVQGPFSVDLPRLLPQAVIPPPPAPPLGGGRKTASFLRRLQWLRQRPGSMN